MEQGKVDQTTITESRTSTRSEQTTDSRQADLVHEDCSESDQNNQLASTSDYQLVRDRARRESKPTQRYGFTAYTDLLAYAFMTAIEINKEEPATYQEAISCKHSREWINAMKEEMNSLYRNQTWLMVKRPQGQSTVACKWIFKLKEGVTDSDRVKYKARLVAKGFTQKEGVDFNEIFSPVVKYKTIRIMLALVAQFNLELEQMDVKTAFLHGDLEETIYMEQPEGFEVHKGKDMVCLLKKSLYGLKQSPRQWYIRFDTFIIQQGFHRSMYDPCLYFRGTSIYNSEYLLLYVDDMLLVSKEVNRVKQMKEILRSEFDMKDLGSARKILGINISRDRTENSVFISQKNYLQKLVSKFSLKGAKPARQPMTGQFHLSKNQCPTTPTDLEYMEKVPYSSAVGSVMYYMICTRPDLAFAISVLSRYMSNPGREHWLAMKWLLRYIGTTSDLGLLYTKNGDHIDVEGFVDSDFAGDRDSRRSTSAYFFKVCGSCVSWKSQLQPVVALSTTEAEYIAATEGIKEGIWIQGLLQELKIYNGTATVFSDSQSAIHLCKNPVFHDRTKHVEVKYHFIREKITQGIINIEKVSTEDNPADFGTKIVTLSKFKLCLDLLGIDKG